MFKRFIKHNKTLVVVLTISLVIILFLFVVLIVQFLKMNTANSEVTQMRLDIDDLLNTRKHKVAAVEENLTLLDQDFKLYDEKLKEIKKVFGSPYAPALDAMASKMQKKVTTKDEAGKSTTTLVPYANGEDLKNDFITFLNANTNEVPWSRLQRFKLEHKKDWQDGINEFSRVASTISFEEVNDGNALDFFLISVGLPRDMYGRTVDYNLTLLDNNVKKIYQHVFKKEILIGKDAMDFGLYSINVKNPEDIGNAMLNLDVTGDLIKRLTANDHPIKSLELFQMVSSKEVPEMKGVNANRYKIMLNGDLTALRAFVKNLNEAYKENRIYVIRDIKLRVPRDLDEGAAAVKLNIGSTSDKTQTTTGQYGNTTPSRTTRTTRGTTSTTRTTNRNTQMNSTRNNNVSGVQDPNAPNAIEEIEEIDESGLPYNERSTYGKLVLGKNKNFDADIVIDYYYVKNDPRGQVAPKRAPRAPRASTMPTAPTAAPAEDL